MRRWRRWVWIQIGVYSESEVYHRCVVGVSHDCDDYTLACSDRRIDVELESMAEKSGSSKEDAAKMHFEKSIIPSEACEGRHERESATMRNGSRCNRSIS